MFHLICMILSCELVRCEMGSRFVQSCIAEVILNTVFYQLYVMIFAKDIDLLMSCCLGIVLVSLS